MLDNRSRTASPTGNRAVQIGKNETSGCAAREMKACGVRIVDLARGTLWAAGGGRYLNQAARRIDVHFDYGRSVSHSVKSGGILALVGCPKGARWAVRETPRIHQLGIGDRRQPRNIRNEICLKIGAGQSGSGTQTKDAYGNYTSKRDLSVVTCH